MRWLDLSWVGVPLAALAACGDGSGGTETPDAPPYADGSFSDTFGQSDAAPMSVPDFHGCSATIECMNPGSECLPVAPLDGMSLCLPRCEASVECPVDTFCYARTDGPYALLKGRCFYSYCGESFGNGETGGPCRVGAEQDIPIGEQLPGWCYPFHDGAWGVCLEDGDVEAGGACDPSDQRCRGEGCLNCAADTVCVEGTCRERCDPRLLLEPIDSQCASGEDCYDRSEVHVFDTGVGRGSWGTCEPGVACTTIGEAACPLSSEGHAQGCLPTNPVRPTGFCDERGTGDLGAGEECQADPPAVDADECVGGTLCVTDSSGSSCEVICDLRSTVSPCTGDTTCQPILWSTDWAIRTQDWGTCR